MQRGAVLWGPSSGPGRSAYPTGPACRSVWLGPACRSAARGRLASWGHDRPVHIGVAVERAQAASCLLPPLPPGPPPPAPPPPRGPVGIEGHRLPPNPGGGPPNYCYALVVGRPSCRQMTVASR